uniref:Uncharacterized protein n=1 Tax=virus sp. ctx9V1 TaxID=2828001 RepID=A0A8S5RDJ7_9VIRU|nr:MAG TPA: hypothetical protein [virus sp. ctx9V1]
MNSIKSLLVYSLYSISSLQSFIVSYITFSINPLSVFINFIILYIPSTNSSKRFC